MPIKPGTWQKQKRDVIVLGGRFYPHDEIIESLSTVFWAPISLRDLLLKLIIKTIILRLFDPKHFKEEKLNTYTLWKWIFADSKPYIVGQVTMPGGQKIKGDVDGYRVLPISMFIHDTDASPHCHPKIRGNLGKAHFRQSFRLCGSHPATHLFWFFIRTDGIQCRSFSRIPLKVNHYWKFYWIDSM